MIDDYTSARFWADIGQWVFNCLVAVYLWFARKHTATVGRIDAACEELDEHGREIGLLKAHPSHGQTERLIKKVDRLSDDVSEVKGRLAGINRAVDLMNEHLINKS